MTLHVGFANHICVQSFIPVHWLFFLYFFIKHVFNIFLFVNVFFILGQLSYTLLGVISCEIVKRLSVIYFSPYFKYWDCFGID